MTLPVNLIEWLWFTFFTVGSLGGWAFGFTFGWVAFTEWRSSKAWRKKK